MPPDTFATRLVAVRRALHLNQEDAAALCAVKASTWATWELGRSPRNMAAVVEQIHRALGVSRDWLMWGREPAPRLLSPVPSETGQLSLPFGEGRPTLSVV